MSALHDSRITEKALSASLNEAVEQHDAEAAKEEISTVGRGTYSRQVRETL